MGYYFNSLTSPNLLPPALTRAHLQENQPRAILRPRPFYVLICIISVRARVPGTLVHSFVTSISKSIIEESGESSVSSEIKQTVFAVALNLLYNNIQHQMAGEVERVSKTPQYEMMSASESDLVSLQRITGWAVKSAYDSIKAGLKSENAHKKLTLLTVMKLPSECKKALPIGLQFLDRGGLTFVKDEFIPWMMAMEKSFVTYLNQKKYQTYEKSLFEAKYKFIV